MMMASKVASNNENLDIAMKMINDIIIEQMGYIEKS